MNIPYVYATSALDTSGKRIWCLINNNRLATVFSSVADLLRVVGQLPVRVPGFLANAELILRLLDRARPSCLEVGSRLAVNSRLPYADTLPAVLGGLACPSWCGGWREQTSADYDFWRMAFYDAAENYDAAEQCLLQHPVWPALSFIPGAPLTECVDVLLQIADPRRFIDPAHPDRSSRLEAWFGLQRKTSPGAYLLETIWNNPEAQASGSWFAVQARKGMHPSRVSRRFLRYLRHNWMSCWQRPGADPFFDPLAFFDDPICAEAWKCHVSGAKTRW